MHNETIQILKLKGIDYSNLRACLVPRSDREEALYLFDSNLITQSIYGREILFQILPRLDSKSNHSMLCGDLLCADQDLVFEILRESLIVANRPFEFIHSSLLFGVYLNNLSSAAVTKLDSSLKSYAPYIGYIPMTYQSKAKTLVSLSMANLCIKLGNTILLPHEDDRENNENVNITLYPFEECGLNITSLQSNPFGIFLSYKIERAILGSSGQIDSEMALNSLSNDVLPLAGFSIQLHPKKLDYLLKEKKGKMQSAGLDGADCARIESMIRSKINASYIYNLTYLTEHDVAKFNIMLEVNPANRHPVKLTAVLEYRPVEKILRVISLH